MAGVVLENVSRVYPGNVVALSGINLDVFDRELLAVVGPSGCGKTTLLRLIAGLDQLSSGKITIGSRDVSDVPPRERNIAMVFQNHALYPHLTVRRNLAFGLELRERVGHLDRLGWLWDWVLRARRQQRVARQSARDEYVGHVARLLGIQGLLDRYPWQVSGGERQRVALGRALVRDPAAFLFDEPLSNLDAQLRLELRTEIRQLHGRLQATMIHVTHDQAEALSLGKRVVVMNAGKIEQIGQPQEVYDWPVNRFVAGFIGTPPMNLMRGSLESTSGDVGFSNGQWKLRLPANRFNIPRRECNDAVLGVRPEDVWVEGAWNSHGDQPRCKVESVETIGDASLVTMTTSAPHAEHTGATACVVSKVDARARWSVGDLVRFSVDPDRVHLFDPATGRNWTRVGHTQQQVRTRAD